jgi:hypothetical protein
MTIFRFSVALAGLFLAGCGSGVARQPVADTPLGKILRIANFSEAAAALKRFTEARLDQPEAVKAEFLAAGFVASTFRNEQDVECQSFHRKSRDIFPVVTLVNICGREVFANAGQQAP